MRSCRKMTDRIAFELGIVADVQAGGADSMPANWHSLSSRMPRTAQQKLIILVKYVLTCLVCFPFCLVGFDLHLSLLKLGSESLLNSRPMERSRNFCHDYNTDIQAIIGLLNSCGKNDDMKDVQELSISSLDTTVNFRNMDLRCGAWLQLPRSSAINNHGVRSRTMTKASMASDRSIAAQLKVGKQRFQQ